MPSNPGLDPCVVGPYVYDMPVLGLVLGLLNSFCIVVIQARFPFMTYEVHYILVVLQGLLLLDAVWLPASFKFCRK